MNRRAGRICAWLWIIGTHALLLWIDHAPELKAPLGDEGTYWRVAERIAAGQPAELPLLWPPLYPYFVAACMQAAGVLGADALWWVQGLQLAVLVAIAAIARDLCIRLLGPAGARIGNWTAFGVLGFPPLVAFAHYVRPELLHLGWFAVALWILAARGGSRAGAIGFGAACGLALLTRSLLLGFLPVLGVALWRAGPSAPLRLALAVGALAVTLSPVLADPTLRPSLAGSSQFNLWVGLNDTARRNLRQPVVGREFAIFESSSDRFAERNRILRAKIAARIAQRGALATLRDQLSRQYFRLFDADSYLTDQLPGGVIAARGGGYRDPPGWAARAIRAASFTLYAITLIGAAAGIALCPPAGRRWMWIALGFLAYNLAIFLLLHAKSRFRVQLLPFLFFYAACALEHWRSGERPLSRARLAAAGAGASLLLFFAFAAPILDA